MKISFIGGKKGVFAVFMVSVAIGVWLGSPVTVQKAAITGTMEPESVPKFNDADLINIVKPSIVRLVVTYEGTASFDNFDFDINLSGKGDLVVFKEAPNPDGRQIAVPLKKTYFGSGFVVNPEGTIVTNAHVVSSETPKSDIFEGVFLSMIQDKVSKLSKKDIAKAADIDLTSIDAEQEKRLDQWLKNYLTKVVFDVKKEIIVLNPSSEWENMEDLKKKGFIATPIKINDEYLYDEKDIAVVKIAEDKLPSLPLGNTKNLATGEKISLFGFPANATLNSKDMLQASVTQGVVSAYKDSKDGNFKYIQTDAKISPGSSGGPVFNSLGQVLGITTLQTQNSKDGTGDLFAYAIPVEEVKDFLSSNDVSANDAGWRYDMIAGIEFINQRRCKLAIEQFENAKKGNTNFSLSTYADPYIENCRKLIADGKSLDSKWDEVQKWLSEDGGYKTIGILSGGALLFSVFAFLSWRYRRTRMTKSDAYTNEQAGEAYIPVEPDLSLEPTTEDIQVAPIDEVNSQELNPPSPPVQVDPELMSFIDESRAKGIPNEAIRQSLIQAGWIEDDVDQAMSL